MANENVQQEYEAFLQDVLNDKKVWLLQNEEGLACQSSLEYEGVMAVLMWSNCILAEAEREGDFEFLEAEALGLYELIFHWLPNMTDENVVCGLNWRSDDGGLEVEPGDLLEHLTLILPEELSNAYQKRHSEES